VQDTALDLGIVDTAITTPRMLAARLEEAIGASPEEQAELRRLLTVVERERFARPGTPGERADEGAVRRLLRRMRGSRRRGDRLRGVFLPRSVFARIGGLARSAAAQDRRTARSWRTDW
jgi:hypothetical protein